MRFEVLKNGQETLVKDWLKQDYVAKHWYGKGLENTLKTLERFVKGTETLFTLWIAYDADIPFAFLMTSEVGLSEAPYAEFCSSDTKAITLDLLIGNPSYLGQGLSCPMIQQFLLENFANKTTVFIDPSLENPKAIHVYEKVGFKSVAEYIPDWCPTPHLMMRLNMSDLQCKT